MLTQFRLIGIAGAAAIAVAASAAAALWPGDQDVARRSPGYGGVCEACDVSGRILVDARLAGGEFRRAKFNNTVMTRVDAADADFASADFTDAILDHGRFIRARFDRAQMTGASVLMTDFSGADLSQAIGLTQSQLSRACGDEATRLPRRLTIPRCDARHEGSDQVAANAGPR